MSKEKTTDETPTPATDGGATDEATTIEKASGELGTDELQKATDEAEVKGFIGEKTDPRPNSFYSQEGGAPGTSSD